MKLLETYGVIFDSDGNIDLDGTENRTKRKFFNEYLNFQVGVDVGGTFTDIFVFDEKSKCIMTAKVPSTKKDQSEGFIKGISTIVDDFSKIKNLVHGSTVGTNALLERRGARTGIITTQGFSDILEMRRRDRPKTWGLKGSYEPIVKKKI